jgi:hypothetical protein
MRTLDVSVEALLGLPLRERSVRYVIHDDLAVSELRRDHHPGRHVGRPGKDRGLSARR